MDSQPDAVRPEDLGARLRAVRELSGVSTRDVARSAGLSTRELRAAERGAKRLSPDQLHALAGALSVDPDVLVGVGFEGELVRAGSVDDRIDSFVGHDPDHWDDFPLTVDDLPPALPVNLPDVERRRDIATRGRIEESWRDLRDDLGDALTSCARLISAGSGDDVRQLLERLESDLTKLRAQRSFLRHLANHERAVQRVRGTASTADQPALATGSDLA